MRRVLGVLFSAVLALALVPGIAFADHLTGQDDWIVRYDANGNMEDNYSDSEYIDQVGGLQPGDDITFTITVSHENSSPGDWYMLNDVISSLEKSAGDEESVGSAYGYLLTYEGPGVSKTLFDSTTVGGDDRQGLVDATDSLDEYVFLQNLSEGETGQLKLVVTLDGETEGNAYFNTLAKLKFGFAIEENVKEGEVPHPVTPGTTEPDSPTTTGAPEPTAPKEPQDTTPSTTPRSEDDGSTRVTKLVKTGDETRLFPFYVAMVVSGLLILALAIVSVRERKEEQREGVR